MDPRSRHAPARAPGYGEPAAPRPPIDTHVVEPEGREELLRGRKLYAAPSLPEHGDPHLRLDVVVGTAVASDHVGSTDLLTRVADDGDFASDTSVRRAGIDPATGQRYLEEMAFEVVNTQRLSEVTAKAEELSARGVRRIFAVFVRRNVVAEWRDDAWEELSPDDEITDRCLAAPVRVAALLRASEVGPAVVRSLLARAEPALVELLRDREVQGEARGTSRGLAAGELAGRKAGLRAVLEARGLALTEAQRATVEACQDAAVLEAWIARAVTARDAGEALGEAAT